jgi:hypothetical protein
LKTSVEPSKDLPLMVMLSTGNRFQSSQSPPQFNNSSNRGRGCNIMAEVEVDVAILTMAEVVFKTKTTTLPRILAILEINLNIHIVKFVEKLDIWPWIAITE